MAFGLNDAAPGVANAMASVAQAIASIQNMKFQRLLMLAQQQREDRLREEDQAYRVGLSKLEHQQALERIDRTKLGALAPTYLKAGGDVSQLGGAFSGIETPEDAAKNLQTGSAGQRVGKAEMLVALGTIADNENIATLRAGIENAGDNFTMPKSTFEASLRQFAGLDKTDNTIKGNIENADTKGRWALTNTKARNAGTLAAIDERTKGAIAVEGEKQGGRESLEDKRQGNRVALATLKAGLTSTGKSIKDAEDMIVLLESTIDEGNRTWPRADKPFLPDAKAALDTLRAAVSSGDKEVIANTLNASRNKLLQTLGAGVVSETPSVPNIPAGPVRTTPSYSAQSDSMITYPYGTGPVDNNPYRYGPSEQIQEPQSWNDVLEMLKKQQGE